MHVELSYVISLIPEDYVKTRAGIGGDLNICEYCNRPYDSCRCNEVYNKALADVRKIFGGLNCSKQTWYQDKHDEALKKQTQVDDNVGGEYKPELDNHWEDTI